MKEQQKIDFIILFLFLDQINIHSLKNIMPV